MVGFSLAASFEGRADMMGRQVVDKWVLNDRKDVQIGKLFAVETNSIF